MSKRTTNYIIKSGDDFYAATDRLKEARAHALALLSYNKVNNIQQEICIVKETKICSVINRYCVEKEDSFEF